MIPKFRLEDIDLLSNMNNPTTESGVKITHADKSMPRCDTGGDCYGCNAAEIKRSQEDT